MDTTFLIIGILVILAGLFFLFAGSCMFYLVLTHTNQKDPSDDIIYGISWIVFSLIVLWRGITWVIDSTN